MNPSTRFRRELSCRILAALAWLGFGGIPTAAFADVRLPAIFSDHLVLQAEAPVKVWGWADPAEVITVSIAGQSHTTTASAAGEWQVTLQPLPGSAVPTTLTVQGRNKLTIEDVLLGEVWLGSGQSNMELRTKQAQNFTQEQAAARFPQIRQFTVRRNARTDAVAEIEGEWQVCSPATVGEFSAVLYVFGRELHQELHRPVGLINSSWGATPIQTWMPLEAVKSSPGYAAFLEKRAREAAEWPEQERRIFESIRAWETETAKNPGSPKRPKPWNPGPPDAGQHMPAGAYQGMIHALTRFRIRGLLWYQGENNAREGAAGAAEYADLQTRLITGWRAVWAQPDLPFLFVQLPNFAEPRDPTGASWAWFREGQARTLAVPHTGMAVTIDVGEPDQIHPRNKQAVGHRLARLALADIYQQKVAAHAPVLDKHWIKSGEIHLSFKNADGGLVARGDRFSGCVIAGADRLWHPATARIEGDRLVLSSLAVPAPVAARYGWANNPACSLYNRAELPVAPFRTDAW
jgi:sialate O-acetylesterase